MFLGHKQYFVSSDVGGGKMQWYAFYNEAPGGVDDENGKYTSLLSHGSTAAFESIYVIASRKFKPI